MRISDWSSDVCSSDLLPEAGHAAQPAVVGREAFQRLAPGEPERPLVEAHRERTGDAARDRVLDLEQVLRRARKIVVSGKSVSLRVDLGGRRTINKQTQRATRYGRINEHKHTKT